MIRPALTLLAALAIVAGPRRRTPIRGPLMTAPARSIPRPSRLDHRHPRRHPQRSPRWTSGICTCGPGKKRTPAVCITADAMRGGGGTIDRNHTLRASQDMLDFGAS